MLKLKLKLKVLENLAELCLVVRILSFVQTLDSCFLDDPRLGPP